MSCCGGVCRAASCFSPPSSFFPPPLLPLLHVRSLANPRAWRGQGAADPPFQRGAAASPEICEGADCRGRRQSGAQPPTLSACARARARVCSTAADTAATTAAADFSFLLRRSRLLTQLPWHQEDPCGGNSNKQPFFLCCSLVWPRSS